MCIAGREVLPSGYGRWIRPVSERAGEELSRSECSYHDGTCPELLDVVVARFLRPKPHDHQTENHLIDPSYRFTKAGEVLLLELEQLLQEPASLWTNSEHTRQGEMNCIHASDVIKHDESLYLVEGADLEIVVSAGRRGPHVMHGVFYLRHHRYKLSVTDPRVHFYFQGSAPGSYRLPGTDVFLCVSLTDPYQWDHRCHKLIAGVIPQMPLRSA